jgi:fatty acid desaturase
MDEQEIREYQQRRETCLTLFLAIAGAIGFLLFLTLVTGGFFLWVMIGLGVIAFVGALHYLLWGKLFDDQVAGEREEMEVHDRAETDEAISAVRGPRGRPG